MEEAKKNSARFLNDRMVKIMLEDGGSFKVSQAILCSTSQYFVAALEGGFGEATDGILRLLGCNSQTFQYFFEYATTKEVPIPAFTSPNASKKYLDFQESALVQLWIFADSCLVRKLQDAVMLRLLKWYNNFEPRPSPMKLVFENTAAGSPLRKACVLPVVYWWKTGRYSQEDKDAFQEIAEFMAEFVKKVYFFTDIQMDKPRAYDKNYQVYMVTPSIERAVQGDEDRALKRRGA